MSNLMALLGSLPSRPLPVFASRPSGTVPGHEIQVWWRLAYFGGRYVTESDNQSSIAYADAGALALQLVTTPDAELGSGIMQVPLGPGERPVFYRVRSMETDQGFDGSNNDAIVYGKAVEGEETWNATLWCMIAGLPGLSRPVPPQWCDQITIEMQAATYG